MVAGSTTSAILAVAVMNEPGGNGDEAARLGERAVIGRIDCQLVQGEPDMQRGIGIEIGVDALEHDGMPDVGAVAADLAEHEFVQVGAAPVGRRDQVLRRGERLQAAAKTRQEGFDRARIAAGLRGDALDDGEKVLRAMAEFAQQRPQRLFAAPVLGNVHGGGDEALDRSVGAFPVGIDPDFEPSGAFVLRNADFQAHRLAAFKDGPLGCGHAFGLDGGQEVGVGLAGRSVGSPGTGEVVGPQHAKVVVLVDRGHAGIVHGLNEPAGDNRRFRNGGLPFLAVFPLPAGRCDHRPTIPSAG